MSKGQGSLEYLIIIAAVLALVSLVVLFLTGAFSQSATGAKFAECRNTALKCYNLHLATPTDPCTFCDTQCKDKAGVELFPGAAAYCKAGDYEQIYEGNTGSVPGPGTPGSPAGLFA